MFTKFRSFPAFMCLAIALAGCSPTGGEPPGISSGSQHGDTRLRLATIPTDVQPYSLCEARGTLLPAERPIQYAIEGQAGDRVPVITWGKMGADWTLVKPLDDLVDSNLVSDIGSIYRVGNAILDSSFSEEEINRLIFGSHWPSASEFLWVRTNELAGRREIADLPLEEDYVLSHKRMQFRQCPIYRAEANQRLVPMPHDYQKAEYRSIGFFDETSPGYLPVDLGGDQIALASDLCSLNPSFNSNIDTSIVYEGNDYDPTANPYNWVNDVGPFNIAPGEYDKDECSPPDTNGVELEVSDEGKLIGQLLALIAPEVRMELESYWLNLAGTLAGQMDVEGVDIRALSRPTWKRRREGGQIVALPVKVPLGGNVSRTFGALNQPGAMHEDLLDRVVQKLNEAAIALANDTTVRNPPYFYFLVGRKDTGLGDIPIRNYRITYFDARRPLKKWIKKYSVFVVAERERVDSADQYKVRHYQAFDVQYTLSLMHARLRELEGGRVSIDNKPVLSKSEANRTALKRQVDAFLPEDALLDFVGALEEALEKHPDGRCYKLAYDEATWPSLPRPVIHFAYEPRDTCLATP